MSLLGLQRCFGHANNDQQMERSQSCRSLFRAPHLLEKEPTYELGHPLDKPFVKFDNARIFGHDSFFSKLLDHGLAPHRDPVWSCLWPKGECPLGSAVTNSAGCHKKFSGGRYIQVGGLECRAVQRVTYDCSGLMRNLFTNSVTRTCGVGLSWDFC